MRRDPRGTIRARIRTLSFTARRGPRGRASAGRRRRVLSACLGAVFLLLAAAGPASALNPVAAENAKPGDSYWRAALQDPVSTNPPIDGYAGTTGVLPGQTIAFHVSPSPAAHYRIEISRLGWYGGSGGRRITCLVGATLDPTCSQDEPGVSQPAAPAPDPVTGEIQAGWPVTDTLTVPAGWVSGYYLAVFKLTSGPDAGETGFTPFIVQAPSGKRSAILVQVPANTWQAYNKWGGEDLYPLTGSHAPVLLEVGVWDGGRHLQEQFLLPAASGRAAAATRPRLVTDTVCDGTSGQVLSPAFGGARSAPLRVAVSGLGRVGVTVTGPRMRPVVRHVSSAGRPVVLTFPSRRLRVGTVTVTLSTAHSTVPQTVRLGAVRVATPKPAGARRRRPSAGQRTG